MPRDTERPDGPFKLRWCEYHNRIEEWRLHSGMPGWFPLYEHSPVASKLLILGPWIREEVAALRARLGGEG